ncbi:MAG: WD40/YVTN/BNR-like repeat-containing protein [Bacteroidota bacterium]
MNKALPVVCALICALSVWSQEKEPVITGADKLNMYASHEQMQGESPYAELHWQYIGPTNISGRCTDVEAVGPKGKHYTIWVASASGGVWKSVNEGVTFEPVFEHQGTSTIGDLAVSPSDPDVVWVGTGEANIFRSSNAGCGVWKTIDGGKNWTHMGLEETFTVSRILVHPENPDIVYVASPGHEWTLNRERGLFKTTNGGKRWEKILYKGPESGVNDMVMDPRDPDVIYATTWQRTRMKWNDPRTCPDHQNNGIWKTVDGGNSWKQLTRGLPSSKYMGRTGIDVARSNPDVVYAFVDDYQIAFEAGEGELDSYGRPMEDVIRGATVYRSDDAGESWRQVSGLTEESKKYMSQHSGTYGWVFGQMRVDPNDEERIYTLGLYINVSNDGGATFERIGKDIHVDHHGMWIDPDNSNYILAAHDGGISVSYDMGQNWRSFIPELPLAQFYNVEYDMSEPFRVFGSIQDHHSYYTEVDLTMGRDTVRPVEWEVTLGAEGSTHAVDPRDNNRIYASLFYGKLARATVEGYPDDMEWVLPENFPEDPESRGQWVAPTILSSHNPDIIYHGLQYVLKSTDRGGTWDKISPDLTYNDPEKKGDISYQTISVMDESVFNSKLLYAGTDDGRLWRTKNGGNSWKEIRKEPMPVRWISRVVASQHDFGTVYVTQTGRRDDDAQVYVWRSTDYGDTWEDIAANIPAGPVNVIREDPGSDSILYLGTDVGVYVSTDRGQQWRVLGDLPCTYVHDLAIHPRDNMIIVATHGRGMFVLDADPVNREKEEAAEELHD